MNTSRVCTAVYGPYCASSVPETNRLTVMSEEHHVTTVGGVHEHISVTHGIPSATLPLPLNSKCLTSVYLQMIARAMELMTKGSVTETRQMIEGQLIESGWEPMNVETMKVELNSFL